MRQLTLFTDEESTIRRAARQEVLSDPFIYIQTANQLRSRSHMTKEIEITSGMKLFFGEISRLDATTAY